MPPVLSIRGLSKSYKGGLQALKTVDLDIERGDAQAHERRLASRAPVSKGDGIVV